jgi:caffeoyl-CoA O-methyltransferase
MELINAAAEHYAGKFSSPEPDLLAAITRSTQSEHPQAHMLSGHVQGRLLSVLSQLIQPRHILEIGTFTGYSALCLCEGLHPEGQLHTIEIRESDANTARLNFDSSPFAAQIHLHIGQAAHIIPQLNCLWDIVFIDADKTGYAGYYDQVFPRVRKGGLIIADNIFFHGQVLDEAHNGKNPVAMRNFTKKISDDAGTEKVILTVRDGLMLIVKK